MISVIARCGMTTSVFHSALSPRAPELVGLGL